MVTQPAADNQQGTARARTPSSNEDVSDGVNVAAMLEHLEHVQQRLAAVEAALSHQHRLATLGTMTSVIAHEFNNILTPIVSYAQFALANPDDKDLVQKALQRTMDGSQRAATICASVLGFARDEVGEAECDLIGTIDEAVACLVREPAKDGIDLRIDVPSVRVAVSPVHLQQIIVNLAVNAIKAMRRKGGKLEIVGRTHAEDSQVVIDVRDTGPGIAEQRLANLFEPFVSHTDAQDGHEAGTGLGLSICRQLVEQAHGSISVASTVGQGTCFTIVLPCCEA